MASMNPADLNPVTPTLPAIIADGSLAVAIDQDQEGFSDA
jgi:hypothetical protein